MRGYASFIPEFEKRLREGHPAPGYVNNLLDYADTSIIPAKVLENMDSFFFFFDIRSARMCFETNGFAVEQAIEMPLAYASNIWHWDGRENIGIIARKPF